MPNKQIRDTILRDYLNDKARMLTICNPLFGTDSRNPDEVVFTTLDGTFFSNLKNDLSCMFRGHFLLIAEHQTTINENMPLRMLMYLCEQLKQHLAPMRRRLYRNPLLQLPRVRCVVLYDGKDEEEDFRVMQLSDAFGNKPFSPELLVEVYNINHGSHNLLMDNSVPLEHYSRFMYRIKSNQESGMSQDDAIREAVRYSIGSGIMADYLSVKAKEVFDMYAFEWNEDDAKAAYIEEGLEKGLEQGLEKGTEFANLNAIRNVMDNFGVSLSQAMNALKIPDVEQTRYAGLLNGAQ